MSDIIQKNYVFLIQEQNFNNLVERLSQVSNNINLICKNNNINIFDSKKISRNVEILKLEDIASESNKQFSAILVFCYIDDFFPFETFFEELKSNNKHFIIITNSPIFKEVDLSEKFQEIKEKVFRILDFDPLDKTFIRKIINKDNIDNFIREISGNDLSMEEESCVIHTVENSYTDENAVIPIPDYEDEVNELNYEDEVYESGSSLSELDFAIEKDNFNNYLKKMKEILDNYKNNSIGKYDAKSSIESYLTDNKYDIDYQNKEGETLLIIICKENYDVNFVNLLLIHECNVNIPDNNGNTALMYACKNANISLVNYLIKYGANIDVQNKDGMTPLIISSKYNHTDITNELINSGAKLYTQDKFGNTALHYSCKNGNIISVNNILGSHYNPEFLIKENNDGESPSFLSIMNEHSVIFLKLMNSKLDLSYKDSRHENNALMFSIKNNKTIIAKNIIDRIVKDSNTYHFYSLNKEKETALSLAIKNNNDEIIKYFIDEMKGLKNTLVPNYWLTDMNKPRIKAMELNSAIQYGKAYLVKHLIETYTLNKISIINIKDINGKYPLFVAISKNNMTIVELLINHALNNNININVIDDNGYTPLTFSYLNNYKDIFYYLLDKLGGISQSDESYKSVLMYAIKKEDDRDVKLIINNSENIDLSDAIDFAIRKKYYKILDIFFNDTNYFVNENNRWESSKIISVIQNNFDIKDKEKMINFFIYKGVNVNSTDREGNSALIYAIKDEYPTIVHKLIEYGANIHNKNKQGETAIEYVKESNSVIKDMIESVSHINITEKLKELNRYIRQSDKESVQIFIHDNKYISHIIINAKDIGETYPLFTAFNERKLLIFKYLLDCGANCNIKNDDGISLLSLAIRNDRNEIVESIFSNPENKINILERDYDGDCPLFEALKKKKVIDCMSKLVDYGIDKGIDMDVIDNNGDTPLTYMYKNSKGQFKFFLDRESFNINQKDASGKSVLFYIIDNDDIEFAEDAISKGADINVKNSFNDTVLDYAIFNDKSFYLLETLLRSENVHNNKKNSRGETTLISIIKSKQYSLSNKEEIVKYIVDEECINLTDSNGYFALTYAVSMEYSSIINILIDNGANINARDSYGYVPYDYAEKTGNFEILCMLKAKGAEPSKNSNSCKGIQNDETNIVNINKSKDDTNIKENYIFVTIDNENVKEIEYLIKSGININNVNPFGDSPLNYAIYKGNVDIINILLDFGNRIFLNKLNSRGETSIITIIKSKIFKDKDKERLIERLIEEGMDVNLVDRDGNSALMYAIYYGNLSLVKLLINNGASSNIKNNKNSTIINYIPIDNNKDILEYLKSINNSIKMGKKSDDIIEAIENNDINMIDQLIKEEGISIVNCKGITRREYPLIIAFNINNYKTFKCLYDYGANLNIKNKDGISLLSLAIKKDRYEIMNIFNSFLKKDVNEDYRINIIEKDANGSCPLIESINQNYSGNVHLLIQYGIKNKYDMKFVIDSEGNTPLTLSYSRGFNEIFDYLLKNIKYFNINQKDSNGNTILFYALRKNDIETIKILENNGAKIMSNMESLVKDPQLIHELIENGNNIFLNNIFNKFNYDKEIICTILNLYKDKKPMSNEEIIELITKLIKIQIEEKMYNTAVKCNIASITILLKNENSTTNEIRNRIEKYNILSTAIKKQNIELIKKILYYIPFNKYPKHEEIITEIICNNTNISVVKILINSFVYELTNIKGEKLKEKFNETNFNYVLDKAIDENKLTIIEYMINYKNIDFNKILVDAIEHNRFNVVKFLIDKGKVDVNHEDEKRFTPIMYAVEKGDFSMIELLVNYNANLNIRKENGKLRLLYCAGDNSDLIKHLYNLGMDQNKNETDNESDDNSDNDSVSSTSTIKKKANKNIIANPMNVIDLNNINDTIKKLKNDWIDDEIYSPDKYSSISDKYSSISDTTFANSNETLSESGNTIITSNSGDTTITNNSGNTTITNNSGNTTITNNSGNTTITDNSGNTTITDNSGNSTYGTKYDNLSVSGTNSTYGTKYDNLSMSGITSSSGNTTFTNNSGNSTYSRKSGTNTSGNYNTHDTKNDITDVYNASPITDEKFIIESNSKYDNDSFISSGSESSNVGTIKKISNSDDDELSSGSSSNSDISPSSDDDESSSVSSNNSDTSSSSDDNNKIYESSSEDTDSDSNLNINSDFYLNKKNNKIQQKTTSKYSSDSGSSSETESETDYSTETESDSSSSSETESDYDSTTETESDSDSDSLLSISDEEYTSEININNQTKMNNNSHSNNENNDENDWDMTDNTKIFYLYKDYNNESNDKEMGITINFENEILKFLGENREDDGHNKYKQDVNCNEIHLFDLSVFFNKNFKKHSNKFKAINYFCNIIFFNFKINPDKFLKGELFKSLQTQHLYDRYLNDKNIKNKNSKFNQIKNIILSYLKKEPDQVTFLLLFNEYYSFYENLYNNLEKNKIDGYTVNVFYSNNSKYMLINIVRPHYLNKYEPRVNGESDYSDVIIITSEDIYKDIKEDLKTTKMNICQLICISFQDDAIKFYYDFQDYIVKECILEKKIEKYYIQTNYGLKLPYQFIKEKFIDSLNSIQKNHDIKEFNVNEYISYREKKMKSELINFIDTIICHPVNHKEFDQNKKFYCISIKFEKNNYISDKFNNYRFIGPLCSSEIEAECEANLLLFKVLYHFGEIKLPILEGRGLTYQEISLSSEEIHSSMSEEKNSKASLMSDEDPSKLKSTSFRCPDIFSKDSWISNDQEPYPNNFYNPNNLFFVSYLEYKNDLSNAQQDLFCYNNIVKIDKVGNDYKRIINKVELCLGYITKKPIPINTPVIDIREYKNDKFKFNLKSWNKYDINFCDNNKNKKHDENENETPNDIIIDNSDCQSYLPVYFSDEELKIIETFQGYSWKMLFGNNNLQSFELNNNPSDERLNDMYYIIPMSKINNNKVEINWEIMKSVNSTMENLQSKNNITLGDWIYYANHFIKNPNDGIYNNSGIVPVDYLNNTFEENCYFLKEFHNSLSYNNVTENEMNEEIKNMDYDTQMIIEKSLKKVYFINKFDKTICFFTGLDRKARKENKFMLNRKSEETKEITYQQFFEDKYKDLIQGKYEYQHKDSPLFSYDAHSLIHSLQREDNDETGEKKNMYIPELYCVFAVPHAWIKLLPLIPIFTYKIKILSFMNEFRYNIGFKKLTLETIYRASMSKSADPVIGEQHERLELLGDSVLKYLSSINILNSYFNRNEDLLIHRRNDFIKNEFLIEQINNLGWKKYSIKQRYSMKNFCPPNFDVKQVSSDLDKKIISEDKNDKSVADFYEALIGACFEDGIKSYKNGMFSIENLYNEGFSLNRKDKAKAIEEGIKLCKLFLIRTKNIITDHWGWEPALINKNIIKVNRKNMKQVSEKLGHKFIENSSLFSVVNYTKETYSKYSISE